MNPREGETVQAEAAHEEYLAEVRQLVDQQVAALFQMISAAASRIGANATAGGQAAQGGDNRTLEVSSGGQTASFAVEAVTDLPEGADRAQEFPAGQARCTMSGAAGTAEQWVLHRVGESGETQPRYAWVPSGTERPLDEAQIADILRSALGGGSDTTGTTGATQGQAGAGAATSLGHEAGIGAGPTKALGATDAIIPVDGDPSTIEGAGPAV